MNTDNSASDRSINNGGRGHCFKMFDIPIFWFDDAESFDPGYTSYMDVFFPYKTTEHFNAEDTYVEITDDGYMEVKHTFILEEDSDFEEPLFTKKLYIVQIPEVLEQIIEKYGEKLEDHYGF